MRLNLSYLAPSALLAEARRELAAVTNEKIFNSSNYEKSREKWCAGMLGLGYEKFVAPCRVAVNDSREQIEADLFLKTASCEAPFQLVEVMAPGRRRGAEYKALAAGDLKGIKYEPGRGRAEGPEWIAAGVGQKVAKNYADSVELNLLVYANFTAHQLQHAEVLEAVRPFFPTFASIWVVTSLWLGSLHVANNLGRIEGWGIIFTPEEYAADEAG
jgi:hypothetical protein